MSYLLEGRLVMHNLEIAILPLMVGLKAKHLMYSIYTDVKTNIPKSASYE